MDQVKVHCHSNCHLFIPAGRQRRGWQLIGAGHQRQSAAQTASGREAGGGEGRPRRSESSQEVPSPSCRPVGPGGLPLRPLRLRDRGQGAVPGAHQPASAWRGGGLHPAVPAVRRLLRVLFLAVAPLLHRPQSEKRICRRPAVERRHTRPRRQEPRWQEPGRGLDSGVSLRPGRGRGGRRPDLQGVPQALRQGVRSQHALQDSRYGLYQR